MLHDLNHLKINNKTVRMLALLNELKMASILLCSHELISHSKSAAKHFCNAVCILIVFYLTTIFSLPCGHWFPVEIWRVNNYGHCNKYFRPTYKNLFFEISEQFC